MNPFEAEASITVQRELDRIADNARSCNGLTTPEQDAQWSLLDDLMATWPTVVVVIALAILLSLILGHYLTR